MAQFLMWMPLKLIFVAISSCSVMVSMQPSSRIYPGHASQNMQYSLRLSLDPKSWCSIAFVIDMVIRVFRCPYICKLGVVIVLETSVLSIYVCACPHTSIAQQVYSQRCMVTWLTGIQAASLSHIAYMMVDTPAQISYKMRQETRVLVSESNVRFGLMLVHLIG